MDQSIIFPQIPAIWQQNKFMMELLRHIFVPLSSTYAGESRWTSHQIHVSLKNRLCKVQHK